MWERPSADQRALPALRQRLTRRRTKLLIIAGVALFVLLDWGRSPREQGSVRVYIGVVHLYQRVGRPVLRGRVRCRFRPSCSEYSIEAMNRFGFPGGLGLTVRRIASCTPRVPLGTNDPLPVR